MMESNAKSRVLLRRSEVEAKTGLKRSAIYNRMSEGTFPRQVRLSSRAVRWAFDEIEAWVAEHMAERTA